MRQLRLRRRVKAVYLYDLETSEAMVLYRRGRVTITDEYSLNTTLNNRSQHGCILCCSTFNWILQDSSLDSMTTDFFQLLKFFVEIRNIITSMAGTRSCFGKKLYSIFFRIIHNIFLLSHIYIIIFSILIIRYLDSTDKMTTQYTSASRFSHQEVCFHSLFIFLRECLKNYFQNCF